MVSYRATKAKWTPVGNWRITGRLKNLIILNSGHNIAPEPLEENARRANCRRRNRLSSSAISGAFSPRSSPPARANGRTATERIQAAIEALNAGLPHYKQVRAFHVVPEPFTTENGLLTANGKLKRDAIAARFAAEIEAAVSEETLMKAFRGKALSWDVADGTIEVVLDRAPCNEIGSTTLRRTRKIRRRARNSAKDAHALIISSARKEGFCAGADLRELYRTQAQAIAGASSDRGVRDFLERIHAVMNAIDAAPLTTIAAVHGVDVRRRIRARARLRSDRRRQNGALLLSRVAARPDSRVSAAFRA